MPEQLDERILYTVTGYETDERGAGPNMCMYCQDDANRAAAVAFLYARAAYQKPREIGRIEIVSHIDGSTRNIYP